MATPSAIERSPLSITSLHVYLNYIKQEVPTKKPGLLYFLFRVQMQRQSSHGHYFAKAFMRYE